jgi:polyhydroxyalkanoate synthase
LQDDDPQHFLQHAQKQPGSWWTHWADWIRRRSGARVGAAPMSDRAALDPAPGRYVRERRETSDAMP